MLSTLQEMLTGDKDAQVVANCMPVLQQVGAASSMCSHARYQVVRVLQCGVLLQSWKVCSLVTDLACRLACKHCQLLLPTTAGRRWSHSCLPFTCHTIAEPHQGRKSALFPHSTATTPPRQLDISSVTRGISSVTCLGGSFYDSQGAQPHAHVGDISEKWLSY